ncbi:hypothetical protein [Sphingobium sp. B2]|uniref:hypothetical protein n=1 Tax=Sphingobium sp. B2 TaxID=2583228 RepID=UPI001643D64C|nr:hypothetical protein [Sphingobium sp. B2]
MYKRQEQTGPYRIPRPLKAGQVPIPANLEDLPDIREEIAQYWNSVQCLDIAVGNICLLYTSRCV